VVFTPPRFGREPGAKGLLIPAKADIKRIASHPTKQLARFLRRGIDRPIRENYSQPTRRLIDQGQAGGALFCDLFDRARRGGELPILLWFGFGWLSSSAEQSLENSWRWFTVCVGEQVDICKEHLRGVEHHASVAVTCDHPGRDAGRVRDRFQDRLAQRAVGIAVMRKFLSRVEAFCDYTGPIPCPCPSLLAAPVRKTPTSKALMFLSLPKSWKVHGPS
jgi:hypothetical protein